MVSTTGQHHQKTTTEQENRPYGREGRRREPSRRMNRSEADPIRNHVHQQGLASEGGRRGNHSGLHPRVHTQGQTAEFEKTTTATPKKGGTTNTTRA